MDYQQLSQGDQNIRIHASHNLDTVIHKVLAMTLECATTAIQKKNLFRFVLTGGRSAKQLYSMLVHSVDNYNDWEFWFGDERNLPEDNPNRNSSMAKESLFAHKCPKHFHPIPYHNNPTTAATIYQKQLEENNATPFDLVLLSLGDDGHIASLFPNRSYNTQAKVIPIENAPKDPPTRISLTAHTLSSCRKMIVMATGADKRDALNSWLHGEKLPITTMKPTNGIDLFTDQPIDN